LYAISIPCAKHRLKCVFPVEEAFDYNQSQHPVASALLNCRIQPLLKCNLIIIFVVLK